MCTGVSFFVIIGEISTLSLDRSPIMNDAGIAVAAMGKCRSEIIIMRSLRHLEAIFGCRPSIEYR